MNGVFMDTDYTLSCAVYFAKRMLREHNAYDDSYQYMRYVRIAARYYKVDVATLKQALSKDAHKKASQKNKKPRKYRYYVVTRTSEQRERWFDSDEYVIKKAISKENATKPETIYTADPEYDITIWYTYITDFATKKEAERFISNKEQA